VSDTADQHQTPPGVQGEVSQVQAAIDTAEATDPLEVADPGSTDGPPADAPPMAEPYFGDPDAPDAGDAHDALGYRRYDCTHPDADVPAAAEAAQQAVERGELVVLPTDTVYGIGADAFNPEAVQRLLDAKVRGRDMPPPVLIADPSLIRALAADIPKSLEDVVEKHWPGPLTVICTARSTLRMDLGETEGTVALRVPDHDLARGLLRRTGPLAVSSANITSLPAAVTCDEAIGQLGSSVAVYLDGGRLGGSGAAPSTIVDFTRDERGEILRHGALSVEVLRQTLPDLVDMVEDEPEPVPETTVLVDGAVSDDAVVPAELVDQDTAGAEFSDQPLVPVAPEGDAEPEPPPSHAGKSTRSGSHALEQRAPATEHPPTEG